MAGTIHPVLSRWERSIDLIARLQRAGYTRPSASRVGIVGGRVSRQVRDGRLCVDVGTGAGWDPEWPLAGAGRGQTGDRATITTRNVVKM